MCLVGLVCYHLRNPRLVLHPDDMKLGRYREGETGVDGLLSDQVRLLWWGRQL